MAAKSTTAGTPLKQKRNRQGETIWKRNKPTKQTQLRSEQTHTVPYKANHSLTDSPGIITLWQRQYPWEDKVRRAEGTELYLYPEHCKNEKLKPKFIK